MKVRRQSLADIYIYAPDQEQNMHIYIYTYINIYIYITSVHCLNPNRVLYNKSTFPSQSKIKSYQRSLCKTSPHRLHLIKIEEIWNLIEEHHLGIQSVNMATPFPSNKSWLLRGSQLQRLNKWQLNTYSAALWHCELSLEEAVLIISSIWHETRAQLIPAKWVKECPIARLLPDSRKAINVCWANAWQSEFTVL